MSFSNLYQTQSRHKHQHGVTLIEMLLAIGILGIVIAGAASLVDNHLERTRSAATAQHMKIFGNAVQAYIKDNYLDLTQANTHNVPTATPSIPAVITVNTLQATPTGLPTGPVSATRYLPSNYNPVNAYGQTICALVLQPKANELYALVVTEGGNPINDLDLGLLAGTLGASGGGIYATASPSTLAKGTMGKWQFDLNGDAVGKFFQSRSPRHCNGSAGPIRLVPGSPLMALWYNQDTSSAFLYRDKVPGHPELNTMQTDLRFKDDVKDLTGAITTPGASLTLQVVRVADTLCDATPTSWTDKDPFTNLNTVVPPGTLARDKDGNLMMCSVYPTEEGGDGRRYWRTVARAMYWAAPVNTFQNLPACNSSQNAYQTRIVKTPSWQPNPTIASIPRAYTCYPKAFGGEWQPMSVDDRGVFRTDRLKLGIRVEGQFCQDPIGAMAQDIEASILICAWNHVWVKPKPSIGRYKFQITQAAGMPDPRGDTSGGRFIGIGYMSSDKHFSGTVYCDGAWYGTQTCGSGGTIDTQSNGMAAFGAAFRGMQAGWWGWFVDQYNKPMVVEVANLQVFNDQRQW